MSAARARAAIARALARDDIGRELGAIRLAPHQLDAARRLAALLAERGGALLADDVGLGKTFVALAVARRYAQVLVVHPAALREMWVAAVARARIAARLVSYEALSRREEPEPRFDLVILDEAHHARSTSARRYRRIAALTAHAHTLLLSATPLINELDELRALLALFLGARAAALDAGSARPFIVRRSGDVVGTAPLPAIEPVQWVEIADDEDVIHRLLALPPPVPPVDGGEAVTLLRLTLVRQWASSAGALRGALRRRYARATAMLDLLAEGRAPTRAALGAWQLGDGGLQLAFPGLWSPADLDAGDAFTRMAEAIGAHRDAVRALLDLLHARPDADVDRAAALIALRERHRGERILAFTEYAETAQGYWQHLRKLDGAARLTAGGGEIASGAVTRRDVLHRFAPSGSRQPPPRPAEAITLLVTTDLLAEGVDLRDATVVVHLDLPWNPARLAQRVGRARRLGSTARRIAVYAVRPPRAAEAILTLEARLRRKSALARSAVGLATESASALVDRAIAWSAVDERCDDVLHPAAQASATVTAEAAGHPSAHPPPHPLVACVSSPVRGWLALVAIGGTRRLAARYGPQVGDDVAVLDAAMRAVERGCDIAGVSVIAQAMDEAARWGAERAGEACVAGLPRSGRIRRRALERIARIQGAMGHARRATMAAALAAARAAVAAPLTAGLEHALERLLEEEGSDAVAWLRAVAALGKQQRGATAVAVEVLIAFAPERRATAFPCDRGSATPS